MKIILCIFLLNITAVSVFGQSVELNDIVGQSVKFPAAVEKGGFLMYGGDPIGESSLATPGIGKYSGRVQWDKCTGLFSLSGLKMEDIGEYKVQNTDKNITVFQLNVYKDNVNVSKPHVSITQNEYPCTIECTAERGTEATLSWYREGQTKPYSRSSVRSAPHLDLPAPVERSGTYTCEAKNSVSNEKASITVGDHCTAPTNPIMWILIAVVLLLFLAIVTYFLWRRFIRSRQAVRTLIQVKEILDNVDPHEYGETIPPDAVGSLIQVKQLLNNVDPHENGFKRKRRAVKTFIEVKKLFDNVDPHEYGDAVQAVPQSAVGSLIEVKEILDNVDPHEYAFGSLIQGNRSKQPTKDDFKRRFLHFKRRFLRVRRHIRDVRPLIQVKKLLYNVDPLAYGNRSKQPTKDVKEILDNVDPHEYAVKTLIQVKKLLDNLSPHTYGVGAVIEVQDLLVDVDQYECDETIPPDAVSTLIQVIKLLDDVDPYEFIIMLLDDVDPDEYIKKIPDNVDPHEYD